MGLLHCQVIFDSITGLPEDRFINNLWFSTVTEPTSLAEAQDVMVDVIEFYTTTAPGPVSSGTLGNLMSQWVSRGASAHAVRAYEHNALTGVDTFIDETRFVIGAPANPTPAVAEAAIVLSFNAALVGGQADRRRRGRIYFGPVNNGALSLVDSTWRPSNTAIATLLDQAKRLHDDVASIGAAWGVFSPTDGLIRDVIRASVDNAMDTMRSRGREATARTELVL